MASIDLVTIADAREQLRIDADSNGSADDTWLAIAISAASEAVRGWLGEDARLYVPARDSLGAIIRDNTGKPTPEVDISGNPTVAPSVRLAVMVEVAMQYRYREGEAKDSIVDAASGYTLNKASTAILTPLRQPVAR